MNVKRTAEKLGIKRSTLANILAGRRRPGREHARMLEEKTGVPRMLWMYGEPAEIYRELERRFPA